MRDNVTTHSLHAPGVYSNFRNPEVVVATAIEYPDKKDIEVVNSFTVRLDHHSGIESIANGFGDAAELKGVPMRYSSHQN